jgi:hypothetical protein
MELGSIFLILAVLIPVVLFISWPILEHSRAPALAADQNISALLARRDQVVMTIQELDDDYALGKIPAESYPEQRSALLIAGADILRQIDSTQAAPVSIAAEDRLEEAILARRHALDFPPPTAKKNGSAVPPVPDDDLEQRIASRRRELSDKAAGFCPKCGRPVHASDRFCPKCGAALV